MSKGAWTTTSSSAVIVAADEYRDYLLIQSATAVQVALGFGETAVAEEGIQLLNAGDTVVARGAPAREAVYAIGDGGGGTYQDGNIVYQPGPTPTV